MTTIERAFIDTAHPALSSRDMLILDRLHMLRMSYLERGKAREAHGVARAMQLVWHTAVSNGAGPASTTV